MPSSLVLVHQTVKKCDGLVCEVKRNFCKKYMVMFVLPVNKGRIYEVIFCVGLSGSVSICGLSLRALCTELDGGVVKGSTYGKVVCPLLFCVPGRLCSSCLCGLCVRAHARAVTMSCLHT